VLPRRPLFFIAVGTAAALVHFLVVVLVVEAFGLAPLLANVVGWLTAFMVSFRGHHTLTFAGHETPPWRAARRFFLVSAAGFAINESAYALCLHYTPYRYDLLLAAILLAVAALTYLVSSRWAFARSSHAL
jgi:putative flippase GtrA